MNEGDFAGKGLPDTQQQQQQPAFGRAEADESSHVLIAAASETPTSASLGATTEQASAVGPATLESFFTLCQRYYHLLPATDEDAYSREDWDREERTEVELIPNKWAEFLRSHTWEDLENRLLKTHAIAWVSEAAYLYSSENILSRFTRGPSHFPVTVVLDEERYSDPDRRRRVISFNTLADGEPVSVARGVERMMQLVTQEASLFSAPDILIELAIYGVRLPWSAETFANFLETESRFPNVRVAVWGVTFSRQQCQALSNFRGNLSLADVTLEDQGFALLQKVANSLGPVELELSQQDVDEQLLHNALINTRSLRDLTCDSPEANFLQPTANFLQLCQAIGQNKSLVSLQITFPDRITDDQWDAFFHSLRHHPSLERLVVSVSDDFNLTNHERLARVIVEMLKVNMIIRELDVDGDVLDLTVIDEEIQPLLERNERRSHLNALADEKTVPKPILFRAALVNPVIRRYPSLMLFLLSNFPAELVAQVSQSGEPKAVASCTGDDDHSS